MRMDRRKDVTQGSRREMGEFGEGCEGTNLKQDKSCLAVQMEGIVSSM